MPATRSRRSARADAPEDEGVEVDPEALVRVASAQDVELRRLRPLIDAIRPFAEAYTSAEAQRGPALTPGQTQPFSMAQLRVARDAYRAAVTPPEAPAGS